MQNILYIISNQVSILILIFFLEIIVVKKQKKKCGPMDREWLSLVLELPVSQQLTISYHKDLRIFTFLKRHPGVTC